MAPAPYCCGEKLQALLREHEDGIGRASCGCHHQLEGVSLQAKPKQVRTSCLSTIVDNSSTTVTTHLTVRPVPALASPGSSHLLPGDHQSANRLPLRAPRKSSLHVLAGLLQSPRTTVLPEVDRAPPVAVVQVSQQDSDHLEGSRHRAEVLAFRRGLLKGHQAIGVDLERRNQSDESSENCFTPNETPKEFAMTTVEMVGQEVLSS